MKLFYKVNPEEYRSCMDKIKDHFNMHEEVDEEKTILLLDDETKIEKVSGSYDPMEDEIAKVRVILVDPSLRDFFNSVFGEPYKEKR